MIAEARMSIPMSANAEALPSAVTTYSLRTLACALNLVALQGSGLGIWYQFRGTWIHTVKA
jgi:hypothetical protein